jgi:hypothetical protein
MCGLTGDCDGSDVLDVESGGPERVRQLTAFSVEVSIGTWDVLKAIPLEVNVFAVNGVQLVDADVIVGTDGLEDGRVDLMAASVAPEVAVSPLDVRHGFHPIGGHSRRPHEGIARQTSHHLFYDFDGQ